MPLWQSQKTTYNNRKQNRHPRRKDNIPTQYFPCKDAIILTVEKRRKNDFLTCAERPKE